MHGTPSATATTATSPILTAPDNPLALGSLLLWSDTLNRADVLIAEIRALQVNAIFGLRCGALLRLLRYEEAYLWGRFRRDSGEVQSSADWSELFRHPGFDCNGISSLVYGFVPPFPHEQDRLSRDDTSSDLLKQFYDDAEREAVINRANDECESFWRLSVWGQPERRDYYLCQGLQILKRNLVADKLRLCFWGAKALLPERLSGYRPSPEHALLAMRRFHLVRSALQAKLREAVTRLGDLHGQFEKTLDLAREDEHSPIATRRRRQGQYSVYLSDRLNYLRRAAHDLLQELRMALPPLDSGTELGDADEPVSFMSHTWRHDVASAAQAIHDDQTSDARGNDAPPRVAMDVFATAYFMPDRPEAQALLAALAARSALRRRITVQSEHHLMAARGPFAELLRKLRASLPSIEASEHGNVGPFSQSEIEDELEMLATILLGVALEGDAFVFALFHRFAGDGLDKLATLTNGRVDLGLASSLPEFGHARVDPKPWWYVYIKVALTWLQVVQINDRQARRHMFHEETPLAIRLREAIEATCEMLLGETRPRGIEVPEHARPEFWRDLAGDLCDVIAKDGAAGHVLGWRQKQLAADPMQVPETSRTLQHAPGGGPLPPDVAEFLIDCLVIAKAATPGRLLHDSNKAGQLVSKFLEQPSGSDEQVNLCRWKPFSRETPEGLQAMQSLWCLFGKTYFSADNEMDAAPPTGRLHLPLFRRRSDISWECSVLRSRDYLIGSDAGSRQSAYGMGLLEELHLDFEPGASLNQIAIEFDVLNTKSSAGRLEIAVNAATAVRKQAQGLTQLAEKLDAWLGPEVVPGQANADKLRMTLDKLSRKNGRLFGVLNGSRLKRIAEAYGARQLLVGLDLAAPSSRRDEPRLKASGRPRLSRNHRPLIEHLFGEKLDQLREIMKSLAPDEHSPATRALLGMLGSKGWEQFGGAVRANVLKAIRHWQQSSHAGYALSPSPHDLTRACPPAIWRVEDISHVTIARDLTCVLREVRNKTPSAVAQGQPGRLDATDAGEFYSLSAITKRLLPVRTDRESWPQHDRVIHATFGRFDAVAISPDSSAIRTPLPCLDSDPFKPASPHKPKRVNSDTMELNWDAFSYRLSGSGGSEQELTPSREFFHPFFERRERGVRMCPFVGRTGPKAGCGSNGTASAGSEDHGGDEKSSDAPKPALKTLWSLARRQMSIRYQNDTKFPYVPPDVLAIVHVTLYQRDVRLEFVNRLIEAVEQADYSDAASFATERAAATKDAEKPFGLDQTVQALEQLGDALLPGDYFYLAEGTGDVLIMLRCLLPLSDRGCAWRIDRINALHRSLVDDILVRRVEVVWTPRVLEYLAASSKAVRWNEKLVIQQEVTLAHEILDRPKALSVKPNPGAPLNWYDGIQTIVHGDARLADRRLLENWAYRRTGSANGHCGPPRLECALYFTAGRPEWLVCHTLSREACEAALTKIRQERECNTSIGGLTTSAPDGLGHNSPVDPPLLEELSAWTIKAGADRVDTTFRWRLAPL